MSPFSDRGRDIWQYYSILSQISDWPSVTSRTWIARKGAESPAARMGKHLHLSTRGRGALRRCSAFFNDRGRARHAARAAGSWIINGFTPAKHCVASSIPSANTTALPTRGRPLHRRDCAPGRRTPSFSFLTETTPLREASRLLAAYTPNQGDCGHIHQRIRSHTFPRS
jgi:hypothetical protein